MSKPHYRHWPDKFGGCWVRDGIVPAPLDPAWHRNPPPILYPPGYWSLVFGLMQQVVA